MGEFSQELDCTKYSACKYLFSLIAPVSLSTTRFAEKNQAFVRQRTVDQCQDVNDGIYSTTPLNSLLNDKE